MRQRRNAEMWYGEEELVVGAENAPTKMRDSLRVAGWHEMTAITERCWVE